MLLTERDAVPPSDDDLTGRLRRYLDITAEEGAALRALQQPSRPIQAGEMLIEEGAPSDRLYVLQRGWLLSSRRLANGARQILGFHFNGCLVGTSSIAWHEAACTLKAVTDCVIADVPKTALGELFGRHSRLGGLLYAVAAAEAVAMSDRLTSIGRMNAFERLATLLLDVRARLRAAGGCDDAAFELPLTQADLGDATGMTKIHVNRTLRAMEAEGVIERRRSLVHIVDPIALARAVGFVDRYEEVATDWLPTETSPGG